jgi:8-oxo-dGTP pyrophosphatase MutT (NUDIX family)
MVILRKLFAFAVKSERLRHHYFLFARPLTLGVRAAIRMPDGKFILVKHTYMPGWHFPGGGLEKNEIANQALIREVEQEVGINIISDVAIFAIFFNRAVSNRDHILLFLCEFDGDLPKEPSSFEIAEISAFGLENLPDDVDPGTVRRMREIIHLEKPRSEW